MGKFESYPQASTLADEDITLFNKNTLTHKISFGTLYNLIRTKLQNSGMVTSVSTGAGLTGGAITSVGTIKCNLVSETNSSLQSNVITEIVGRQYAVVPDSNGKLSVNVPWTDNGGGGETYLQGDGINIDSSNVISTKLKTYTKSQYTAITMPSSWRESDRQYPVELDYNGVLSVNVPWEKGMDTDGSNAQAYVNMVDSRLEVASLYCNSLLESGSIYGQLNSKSRGKFGDDTLYSYICMHTSGNYYTTNTTESDSTHGLTGTVKGGVELTLELDTSAIYLFICTSYANSTSNASAIQIAILATSRSETGNIKEEDLTHTSFGYGISNNCYMVTDTDDLMFSLIRLT